MRCFATLILVVCLAFEAHAEEDSYPGPSDAKAQKTFQQGLEYLKNHDLNLALWYFRKADQQDHGHCLACQRHMIEIGLGQNNWKAAEEGASRLAILAQAPKTQATAHYGLAMALVGEGKEKHQNDLIARAH